MNNNNQYTPKSIINIESEYNKSLYEKTGFFESGYPLTQMGLYFFLTNIKHIKLYITRLDSNNKWIYAAAYIDINGNQNTFTEDLNEYDSFNEMINSAIIECFAFLTLNNF